MKVLVTGGAGFIGTHLCRILKNKGWDIRILDIVQQADKDYEYEYFQGDIRIEKDVEKAVKGVDWVIHLAAKHHDFGVSREEFFSVNEYGMKILLDSAAANNVKKIVFLSSVAVYGNQINPTTEMTIPDPINDYGRSKLAGEKVLGKWALKESDSIIIIIRPTIVFGIYNFANMYNLIKQISRGHYIQVGKGQNVKSIAYVENLIGAILFLIKQEPSGVNIYNYADEPHFKTKELVDIIAGYLGKSSPKIRIPYWFAIKGSSIFDFLGHITGYNFPITSARIMKFSISTHHTAEKIKEKGFEPSVKLEKGIAETVNWLCKNNFL
ncbi:MAG: NAD(P)-dependent oxidoreductase [bacterium]